jgi:hypothetical protein
MAVRHHLPCQRPPPATPVALSVTHHRLGAEPSGPNPRTLRRGSSSVLRLIKSIRWPEHDFDAPWQAFDLGRARDALDLDPGG